jgi:predicted DNA binding CopG/RHH family protein
VAEEIQEGEQGMKKVKSYNIPGYDPTKVKLTKEEQDFEDKMNPSDYIEREPKSERMNIRLSQEDLERIKALASKLGIPYQTLVGSVIHRYVTSQLVDLDEVRKVFDIKEKKRA